MLTKNKFCFLIIFFLIFWHFYSNYIFLKNGSDITGCDVTVHLINKIEFHNRISKIFLDNNLSAKGKILQIYNSLNGNSLHPPMTFVASFFITSIFGNSTFVAELSNILYLAILFSGVYILGKWIAGEYVGLLAAFIIFSSPVVSVWSKKYGSDLPLMSWGPWVIFALLSTNRFKNIKISILFGLLLGFVILFKSQIIIFIIGPLLYVLFVDSRSCHFQFPTPSQIRNIGVSLLLTVLVSFAWWHGHLYSILINFSDAALNNRVSWSVAPYSFPIFSLESFYFYIAAINIGIGFFYIILFASAFFYAFYIQDNKYIRNILFLWIIVPYLLFTLMVYKFDRWYFPAFPFIALFIALQLDQLKIKKIKRCLIISILLLGLGKLIKNNFSNYDYYWSNIRSDYEKETQQISAFIKKEYVYSKNLKMAFFCPDELSQHNEINYRYALIREYPEITILDISSNNRWINEVDFIIVLPRTSAREILWYAWCLGILENNILFEKHFFETFFNTDRYRLRRILEEIENNHEIQKAKRWLRSLDHFESYFFHFNLRAYYVSKIKKELMTIEQCAQLLKLSPDEIISWINNYNQGRRSGIISKYQKERPSFNMFTEYYKNQEKQKLAHLLKYFTIVEKRAINSNFWGTSYNIFFMKKREI